MATLNPTSIPTLDLSAFAISTATGCIGRDRLGNPCYKIDETDMTGWCPSCLDGHDPAGPLPEWMGGIDAPAPSPDAQLDRFEPTDEELADYGVYLDELSARESVMEAMALDAQIEAMEAAFADTVDHVHPAELIECGYRPAINRES